VNRRLRPRGGRGEAKVGKLDGMVVRAGISLEISDQLQI